VHRGPLGRLGAVVRDPVLNQGEQPVALEGIEAERGSSNRLDEAIRVDPEDDAGGSFGHV
jgi:hypothetical protein